MTSDDHACEATNFIVNKPMPYLFPYKNVVPQFLRYSLSRKVRICTKSVTPVKLFKMFHLSYIIF